MGCVMSVVIVAAWGGVALFAWALCRAAAASEPRDQD
jgi:hypothetical protein